MPPFPQSKERLHLHWGSQAQRLPDDLLAEMEADRSSEEAKDHRHHCCGPRLATVVEPPVLLKHQELHKVEKQT